MTHPPATCELCGGTGLYSPPALPCPKGCKDIVDRLITATHRRGWETADDATKRRNKAIADAADEIERLRQALSEAEAREPEARVKALEEAAKACDRIAGNTADFDKYTRRASGMCAAAIRALKDEVR